jgi:Protein of unknown function (DUF2971)
MSDNDERLLNHYTDAVGLEGITRSGELWCTGVRHLNDRSEFHYVHDAAADVLNEVLGSAPEAEAHYWSYFLEKAHARPLGSINLREMEAVGACYVASFSEKDDDLNQFRAYGARSPFQLRFSIETLQRLADKQNFQLMKCDYSYKSLRTEIDELIRQAHERISKMVRVSSRADNNITEAAFYDARRQFWDAVLALAPRFKHGKFQEEQEWRLVSPFYSTLLPEVQVNFRVRDGRITPYLNLKLFSQECPESISPFGTPTVLREVRVGPTNDLSLDFASTVHLLQARDYLGAGVSASSIPYRA